MRLADLTACHLPAFASSLDARPARAAEPLPGRRAGGRSCATRSATTSGSAGTSRCTSRRCGARRADRRRQVTSTPDRHAPASAKSARAWRGCGDRVGRVLGPAHPLDFWVGVADDSYLQLDDIVAVETQVPGRGEITLYGVVDIVRAKYEGAKFDSDVFRVARACCRSGIATAAHVSVTRIEPEIFVPPQPGQPASRAMGAQREEALYFDQMKHKFAAGLSREGDVIWGNLEFLDGTRGAHVNISGISGVATKTSLRDVPAVLAVPLGRAGHAAGTTRAPSSSTSRART